MDEKGILRCKGRLENAPIPFDARYPILLPRCSRFTHLVINECHLKVLHNGVRDTLYRAKIEILGDQGTSDCEECDWKMFCLQED